MSPDEERSRESLDTVIFVFQILMALALTNGAFLFFTRGGTSYILRPFSSYSVYDIAVFLLFASALILFIHGDVLVLRGAYRSGFSNKKLMPIIDFVLLFIHSALFYMLSHTLATIDSRPLDFYEVLAIILGINVCWAVISAIFDKERRVALIYASQNTIALIAGIVIFAFQPPGLKVWLAVALGARNLADIILTYDFFFPNAFPAKTKRSWG
jgi:hypothetical protein